MTEPRTITFTIPGEPRGKGRPRSCVVGGRIRHYTPKETANYENLVRLAFLAAAPRWRPWAHGVQLAVHAYSALPKSRPVWQHKRVGSGVVVTNLGRPDLDNILKILDGLNGVAYRDDAQVWNITATKTYCADLPRVEVTVVFNEGLKK
jgi:Holliday junction resolvase RusA-like endonuclease